MSLPAAFKESFSYYVKNISDNAHKELSPKEICDIFERDFVNLDTPLNMQDCRFEHTQDSFSAQLNITHNGTPKEISGRGNGRLDSIANALRENLGLVFEIIDYNEHALKKGSNASAICYVQIESQGKMHFGVGIHSDIIMASVYGLISAINNTFNTKD